MGFSSQGGRIVLRTQATPATFPTDLSTAGIAMKLRSGSLAATRDLLIPDPEIGGGRDVADAYLGAVAFAGDYEFYGRMQAIATLLYAALGVKSTPAPPSGVTGATLHTITPSDASQLPFLAVEERIGAGLEVYQYTDAVVNTFHLEADANGYLMGTAGLIAKKQVAGATAVTDPPSDDTPMSVGTNIVIKLGGVALPAKSFSLDINNNFENDDFRLGSLYLADLTPKRREVTMTVTIRPEDSALWRQATYGTSTATSAGGLTTKEDVDIMIQTYETISGSTPATPYSLDVKMPKAILKPYAFSPSGDDIIENDIDIQAVRPDLATDIMSFDLVTDLAEVA